MNNKDNRILPGGELTIDNTVNGISVPDTQPSQQYTRPAQPGSFPEVDFNPLNDALIYFLKKQAKLNNFLEASGQTYLKLTNTLMEEPIEQVVQSLGHSFFKLENLHYNTIKDLNHYYLVGDLKLNTNIPFESFKKGVSAMLGKEIAEYFLEEYGDRIGIQDQTKPFDVTKPEIQEYLPGIQAIKNLSGPVHVMNNPYLLLLSLDLENRKYATHFFNEAMNKKMYPIMFDHTSFSNVCLPNDYVFTDKRISEFTENPHIITFEDLLKISKTYNIKGIAAYGDRLKKFREQLKQIPRT